MRHPLGQQQRVELRRLAVVEAEDELAAVLADALQRVRQPGREIPQPALVHVLDVGAAVLVDGGDAADALVTNAHSANTCQCISRMPPRVRRMLTPAIVSEIWKSDCVTWRAQPPFWMRRGALLKEAQNIGRSPTSVAGGDSAPGNCPESAGLFGPMTVVLEGLFSVLMAPCGGSSGLPKVAACAVPRRGGHQSARRRRHEDVAAR